MTDLDRTPLLDDDGVRLLRQLREHADAPRWNYAVGDRLRAHDLPALDHFRSRLVELRGPRPAGPPAPPILQALAALVPQVPWYREHLPDGARLGRDWHTLPTTSRRELSRAPWELVPDSAELDRLVIYRTAGTTGHPIEVPHHPRAVACYQALLEHALAAHGVRLRLDPRSVACFLISAQVKTYTYSTVLYAWAGAGFAKLNLRRSEWPRAGSARRYLADFAPPLITGEPVAFAELMEQDIAVRPLAMVSTSLALSPALAGRLRARFGCPVIDWYSMVETGPIAYACPAGDLHLLPHDLHLELLDAEGAPVAPGERGEITVSGGRNPYLPLMRYRTGDSARLAYAPCRCGDPMPRLLDLEGRRAILFRASDGTPVGAVDLSRLLREFPLLAHAFHQRADRSCVLLFRPRPDATGPAPADLERALRTLLGTLPIDVSLEPRLGEPGGPPAYVSELPLEP